MNVFVYIHKPICGPSLSKVCNQLCHYIVGLPDEMPFLASHVVTLVKSWNPEDNTSLFYTNHYLKNSLIFKTDFTCPNLTSKSQLRQNIVKMRISFSLLAVFIASALADGPCDVESDNCRAVINASACFNKYMAGGNPNKANVLSCLKGTDGTDTETQKVGA